MPWCALWIFPKQLLCLVKFGKCHPKNSLPGVCTCSQMPSQKRSSYSWQRLRPTPGTLQFFGTSDLRIISLWGEVSPRQRKWGHATLQEKVCLKSSELWPTWNTNWNWCFIWVCLIWHHGQITVVHHHFPKSNGSWKTRDPHFPLRLQEPYGASQLHVAHFLALGRKNFVLASDRHWKHSPETPRNWNWNALERETWLKTSAFE